MRKNHETYDVDWDYGSDYEDYAHMADWSKIFDAELAIARAFYSDSDVLILDEPTASLDAIAEQETGTHIELMKQKGLYYELFSTQANRYITESEHLYPLGQ